MKLKDGLNPSYAALEHSPPKSLAVDFSNFQAHISTEATVACSSLHLPPPFGIPSVIIMKFVVVGFSVVLATAYALVIPPRIESDRRIGHQLSPRAGPGAPNEGVPRTTTIKFVDNPERDGRAKTSRPQKKLPKTELLLEPNNNPDEKVSGFTLESHANGNNGQNGRS